MPKLILFLGLVTGLFLLIVNSCTKTVTDIKTVTVTDTVTNTIIDSNINLNNGLVAYYPFNGNVNDSGINQLNGTSYGGVNFTPDVSGKANSAVNFDGSTGYIIVPDPSGKFQSDAFTIAFFTKLTDITPNQVFVTDVNFSDGSGESYAMSMNATGPVDLFQFGVAPNTTNCTIPAYDVNNAINGANLVAANKWYHVVDIFSNGLQQIYINGVLNTAITRNFTSTNKCSANSLTIGGFWQNGLLPLHGSIDEMRIYNRALNQNEITALARPVQ